MQAFPSLSLLQVYAGITFYLAHRAQVDAYLKRGEAKFKELAQASRDANPLLYAKIEAAKRATPSRG